MLFIGHFSFDEIDDNGNLRHGYLSSLVDAQSPDDAAAKFEHHIRQMKDRIEEMARVVHIYIEEILKFSEIPATPITTRLQFSDGPFPKSVSHSLPGTSDSEVESFGFSPDVEKQEAHHKSGYVEAEPFITFAR